MGTDLVAGMSYTGIDPVTGSWLPQNMCGGLGSSYLGSDGVAESRPCVNQHGSRE